MKERKKIEKVEVIVTVGIALAIVATTAALAPAITPSVYAQNKN